MTVSAKFLRRLAFIVIIIITFSCSDNEATLSKRPLLIGKSWTIVRYEMDGEDVTDEWEECDLDNTTTFFDDGTFTDEKGSVACDEFETVEEGTWQFKANETVISLRPSGESASDWTLHELTDNTLKISQYVSWLDANVAVVMTPL